MQNTIAVAAAAWIGLQAVTGVESRQVPPREFSCTSFPAELSEADLVRRYGSNNVRRASVFGSDDGPQDGTVLFDSTAEKLEAVWRDPETRTGLAWIRTREHNSPWQTPNGIAIGVDLLSIERRNGGPFRLAALGGPEGQGIIRSWGRGRLRSTVADRCSVNISLQPTRASGVDSVLLRQVVQGREFSSGHPAMQAINPRVAALTVAHDSGRAGVLRNPRPGRVRKIRDARPVWPDAARRADVRGTVLVEFTIAADGSVTDARILRGIALLNEAALECVRQWRYEPVLLDGRPIPRLMTAAISFP